MKAKIFTIMLLLASFGLANAQPLLDILKVPAGAEPTIDGLMDSNDPWSDDDWIPMDELVPESTTSAMSAQFQILHNDEFIFIILEAFDATPNNDPEGIPNTWERDNIEIFFHMDSEVTSAAYVAGVTSQLRFQRDGDGENGLDGTEAVVNNLNAHDDFAWMVVDDISSFIFEARFPIEALNNNGDGPFNGTDFFFDIKYADNTTGDGSGRTQQNYWADPDDNKYQDATLFSHVALSQTEIEVTPVNIEINSIASSIYVANNMLKFTNLEGDVRIYNLTGALVKASVIERDGSIDISSLNSGLYIVKTKELTVKIVK